LTSEAMLSFLTMSSSDEECSNRHIEIFVGMRGVGVHC